MFANVQPCQIATVLMHFRVGFTVSVQQTKLEKEYPFCQVARLNFSK